MPETTNHITTVLANLDALTAETTQEISSVAGIILSVSKFTANKQGQALRAPIYDFYLGMVEGLDETGQPLMGEGRMNLRVFADSQSLASGEIDLSSAKRGAYILADYRPGSNGSSGLLAACTTYSRQEADAFVGDAIQAALINVEGGE